MSVIATSLLIYTKQTRMLFSTLCWISLIQACGSESTPDAPVIPRDSSPYSYQQPELSNDGWSIGHINDFGIEATAFDAMMNNIRTGKYGYRFIDSVVIIKNNTIIFDEQMRTELDLADSWANNTDLELHILNSVTKSFTSALIGIAIDQAYIENTDVKIHDYFQHKQPIANWSQNKEELTLKNWLTMRHGYQWDEWNVSYLDSSNQNSQMNNAQDPMQFLLDQPMVTNPGETFAYSTGVSFGIGRLLEHATNQSVIDFMTQNLFDPLGIKKWDYWNLDGQLHTGSALYLTARDMAKFGQLFLNNGQWNNEQLISASWVAQSTAQHHDSGNWGYGYQWWTTDFTVEGNIIKSYYADGFGGQYIFVLPEIDAVVVFNGHAYQDGEIQQYSVRDILTNDILPLIN